MKSVFTRCFPTVVEIVAYRRTRLNHIGNARANVYPSKSPAMGPALSGLHTFVTESVCMDESMYKSEFQDCNGKCIGLSIPCNGKCLHPNYPERCIDHCLDANTFCKGDWGEMKSTKMI